MCTHAQCDMGHGQYLVYSSKSSIFEECIIVFQVLVYIYISICYRFLKSVLSFSKPQLNFQQIKMSRILLSINLNFGCSSHVHDICINTSARTAACFLHHID